MRHLCEYVKALDQVFNDPPQTVPEHCMKILNNYPVDIVTIDDISYMMVVKIHEGFYGVSWVLTKPEYQGKGYGSQLLQKVHTLYQGVFITKTRTAARFYMKHGYVKIYEDQNHSILAYVNDKEKVIF